MNMGLPDNVIEAKDTSVNKQATPVCLNTKMSEQVLIDIGYPEVVKEKEDIKIKIRKVKETGDFKVDLLQGLKMKEEEDTNESPTDGEYVVKSVNDVLMEATKSPPPKSEKSKGKKARGRRKKDTSERTAPVKAETGGAKPKKPEAEKKNHLLTDFFPVRRSVRVPAAELKRMHQKKIEEAILSNCVDGLSVEEFPIKGRGVVAKKTFRKGDFVVEYAGDLIDLDTAKQRDEDYTGKSDVGCYMYYFNHKNKSYCIDATAESGKLGRLLNHSKTNPNCCTKVVDIDNRPYLIIVAAKDISVGEELLYDYGDRNKETLAANPWLAF